MGWYRPSWLSLLSLALLCHGSFGLYTVYTEEVCQQLDPNLNKGIKPQVTPAPFTISIDKSVYNPGESLQVTITTTGAYKIHGFLVKAHRINPDSNQDQAIGYFEERGNAKAVCSSQYGRGLAQNDAFEPTRQTRLVWNAPSTRQGHVEFRATILSDNSSYWLREKSSWIAEKLSGDLPSTTTPPVVHLASGEIDLSSCGDTKGCYRSPKGCAEPACDIAVTWQDQGDVIEFEMSADIDGWVAVGFSEDKKMGKDDVTECVWDYEHGKVLVRQSWNEEDGKKNTVLDPPDLGLVGNYESYKNDGRIGCRFWRTKSFPGRNTIFDLGTSYHILMTRGPVSEKVPAVKRIHEYESHKYPYVTPDKVSLLDNVDLSARAKYPLVKVHGCLMLLGFLLFAPTAILLAKYYKPMWPNDKLCGTKVWFALHRGCLLTTLVLLIIGFILIFVHAGQYTQLPKLPEKAHPPIGITTTILCILNPLLALCRCSTRSRWRPIFNWIHLIIGVVASVLSIVAMFIGLTLPKADVPYWASWILGAFLLFHLIIELMLEIHGCINSDKQKLRDQEYQMMKKGDMRGDFYGLKPEPVGYHFKRRILAIYLVVAIIVNIILVITIAVC